MRQLKKNFVYLFIISGEFIFFIIQIETSHKLKLQDRRMLFLSQNQMKCKKCQGKRCVNDCVYNIKPHMRPAQASFLRCRSKYDKKPDSKDQSSLLPGSVSPVTTGSTAGITASINIVVVVSLLKLLQQIKLNWRIFHDFWRIYGA